jgi:uncharacterized protein (DUF1800 family)
MIFNQAATAKYLVRKLHYWFVGFDITPTVESNIINPLAAQLQADNYNILPTIRRLLLSEYFYDAGNVGGLLKNPIDFVLSFIKRSRVTIPTDPVQRYNAFNAMRSLSATYGMEVFNPPGVAGWEAYHQEPGFQKLWINSVTLPQRNGFTDSFVNGSSTGGYTFGFNAVTFLPTICSTPADANAVVQAFVNEFLVFPLTTAQINHLRDVVFLNNQTTAWWTTQWNNYIANPTNTTATNTVRDRLRPLLRVIFRMAEYQIM